MAFDSDATDLTTTPDSNGTRDVFVRDLTTGTTTLVSRNAAGLRRRETVNPSAPAITPDGRFVAFDSLATDLTTTPDSNNRLMSSCAT